MRRFYDFKTYSASENPMQHPIQIRTYAIRWRSAFALERFVDVRTVAAELGGTSKIMLPHTCLVAFPLFPSTASLVRFAAQRAYCSQITTL